MTLTPTPDSGADAAAKIAIPDPAPVLALIDAFRSSKVMFVAVSLGLFDSLEREPSSAERLAAELQLQSEPLQRLLDACVGLGLLHKRDGVYKNEPVASTYLRRLSLIHI